MERPDKHNNYLDLAQTVAQRGTCIRRNYGAVIVKNDEVIATGYSGAPRGMENCCDIKQCKREVMQVPSGERYELCRSVHAEQNAIISAARRDMIGSTLYLVGVDAKTGELYADTESCNLCKRFIINAGIDSVVTRRDKDMYEVESVNTWRILGKI